jgi:uncharacterized membrane protein (UPF0127 family)
LNKLVAAALLILIAGTLYLGYIVLKPAPSNTARIVIVGVTLNVEIAKTPSDQEKGLSDRDSIAPDHGMLFVFDSEGSWGFWMKGMRFSLDIIWFDSQRHAVYIEQALLPCTPQNCPVYVPPVKATYVLEVNAGFVRAHNISLGDTFNFVG